MLSKISQRKANNIWFHLYVEVKNNINEQTKQKQIHRYRKQTHGCQRAGGVEGMGKKGEGIEKHRLVFNSPGYVKYSTGNTVNDIGVATYAAGGY